MKIYFVILLILPFISFSQIIDNFDDSEIENNPQWYGDIKKYEVIDPPVTGDGSLNAGANDDNYVLRSLQNESDAIIKLENATAYGEWRFSVADGGNWSISSTNDYKIILMSDDSTRANLVLGSHNFNGYYLRFDGSNSDQFVLYRQNGTTSTVVLNTGYPASVDGTTPIGRSVKVIRTQIGEWSIFIDEGFNVNPSTQRGSTVVENSITSSEWFGIATNIDNPGLMRVLYFDNLYIGPVIADTIKPYIQNVEIISSGQLDVFFNETIDTITSQIALNYFINNSIGNPDSAVIDISQHNLVHLYLNNQLVLGTYYILSVENIEDFSGNIIDSANYNFIYYIIQHYDIVINEIMADPNPVQYLPDFEYIELNNTTPYDLELKNWTLTVGTTIKTIPTSTIDAFGYMILCNTTAESSFQTYGSVTGISSFPALTNGGATIIIKNEIDSTISTITYSDTWYQDPLKAAGGWSIEKIDPLNQCGGYTNWIASNNYLGGTPGSLNSVYTSNIDTTAPYAENLYVLNSQQISVEFSEPINSSLISLSDFSVNNGIGNSVYFEQDATNSRIFTFSFSNDFIVGQENILTILNITDDCQNTQLSQELLFTYYEANQFDVVINEIMADPNPVIGLPEYEYLELYNRSDFDITLTNWQLKIGTKTQIFSVASIASKSYLIVSSSGGISELQEYGEIIDVIGSTDLTNSGASICLIDQYGKQIHSVTYSSTWHENSYKADGGWSLEQIDYNNPCGGVDNWLSSTDSKGGTPGLQNSVYNVNNDIDTPGLIRAIVIDTNTIKIFFDESLDTTTVFNPSRFIADNGLGNPLIINPVEYFYNSIILTFSNNLVNGIIYTLNITDSIADCSGNIISDIQSCRFAIPDSCETSDLVINEILFNPVGEVVDFVEIYNRSDKVFDLNDLFVASRKENLLVSDPYQWELYPVNTIDEEGYLVFPGEYYILSENSQIIIDQYYTTNEKGFIEIDDLPSLNDDDGIIIIADKWLNIIDEFHYSTEMHFSLINDIEGISLERINFDNPTQDAFNWHSAAESVGNATPAYINSQYNESESSIGEVILDPEIFSPDNDGYNDFLTIAYKFEKTGLVGNIVVYDAKGRIVRKLMQNELLAVDGSITWDGINDYNTKANIGIYLIYFEIYDLEGNVEKFRKICVLATKLND